jgi:hypothetical protein
VLWTPAPTSSRATRASSSTSAAGEAMEMTRPTTVRVLSVVAGFIRNTHDSSPEAGGDDGGVDQAGPVPSRGRARISSTTPVASGRYPAR